MLLGFLIASFNYTAKLHPAMLIYFFVDYFCDKLERIKLQYQI